MKWILLLSIVIYAPFHLNGQTPENPFEQMLSPAGMAEDLDILAQTLLLMHPGFYAYTSPKEMDEKLQKIRERLQQPLSTMAYYRLIGPLLSAIGDVHTDLEPCPAFYDMLNTRWPVFPLSVVWLEEALYVSHNLSGETDIEVGDRLISINDMNADSLFKVFRQYVPRDGHNLTSPNHTLSGKYGGFRNFYASFFEPSKGFTVEIIGKDGQQKTYALEGVPYRQLYDRGNALLTQEQQKRKKPQLNLKINGQVATLRVSSFHPGKIRDNGQRFKTFFAKAFRQLQRDGVEHLILDVRGNGGGHESVFMELFSYLHAESFITYRELSTITDTIPNSQYFLEQDAIAEMEASTDEILMAKEGRFMLLNEPGTSLFNPQKPQFTGQLYVLVDGRSSSATGDFAGLLQEHQKGIFIGEEIGGNSIQNTAGMSYVLELPHSKVNVIIPTILYLIQTSIPNTGHGVIPDYEIPVTVEDFRQNNDSAMEFTRKLIGG